MAGRRATLTGVTTGSLYTGYVADPFVLKTEEGYVAYGTCPERSADDGR